MKMKNKSPFEPWNDAMRKDSPFEPWNSPMYKDDPFAPWNSPFGNKEDLERYEREHGLRHTNY